METTSREYKVKNTLDSKKGDDGKMYCLVRVDVRKWLWAVGINLKSAEVKIPKGTPCFKEFGDAVTEFNKK